jgi:hypothetical protein
MDHCLVSIAGLKACEAIISQQPIEAVDQTLSIFTSDETTDQSMHSFPSAANNDLLNRVLDDDLSSKIQIQVSKSERRNIVSSWPDHCLTCYCIHF